MSRLLHGCLSLLLFALCLVLPGHAEPSGLSLNVQLGSENQSTDNKSPNEVRARWLTVRVTNATAEKLEGLSLNWALYAVELKKGANDVVLEKSGEEKFSVEANGRFTDVTTAKVPFKWTRQHAQRSGRRVVKVPESGRRYYGYTVRVMKDGVVLAEHLSGEAMRKHME